MRVVRLSSILLASFWTTPWSAGLLESIPSPPGCLPQFRVPFKDEAQEQTCEHQLEMKTRVQWLTTNVSASQPPAAWQYQRQCPNCTPLYMLCITPDSGAWNHNGKGRILTNLMFERLNMRQMLPGYELMCDWHDGNCKHEMDIRKAVNRLAVGPRRDKYVAAMAVCGGEAKGVWQAIQWTLANLPGFFAGARNPEFIEYDMMFRTAPTENLQLELWTRLIQIAGWKRIAIMSGKAAKWDGNFYMLEKRLMQMKAVADLTEVHRARMCPGAGDCSADDVETNLRQVYQEQRMKRIILLGYGGDVSSAICAQWKLQMPDVFWMLIGWTLGGNSTKTALTDVINDPDHGCVGIHRPPTIQGLSSMIEGRIIMYMGPEWDYDLARINTCTNEPIQQYKDELLARYRAAYPTDSSHKGSTTYFAESACAGAILVKGLLDKGHNFTDGTISRDSAMRADMKDVIYQMDFQGISGKLQYRGDTGNSPLVASLIAQLYMGSQGSLANAYVGEFDAVAGDFLFVDQGDACSPAIQNAIDSGALMDVTMCRAPFFPQGDSFNACDQGQELVDGICKGCPMGSFFDAKLGCRECAAGTHGPKQGLLRCEPCPVHSFSNFTNHSTCSDCGPGTEQPEPGSVECAPCPAGKFKTELGRVPCSACPLGTYAEHRGAKECAPCGGGLETLMEGATRPSECACPSDTYLAGGECASCRYGTRTSGGGKTSPADCELRGEVITAIICFVAGVHLAFAAAFWARRAIRRAHEAAMQRELAKGLHAVKEPGFPMVLINATKFVSMTKDYLERSHEQARDDGLLLYLDSPQKVASFKKNKQTIIFFSYQWTSWIQKGPDALQFHCMKAAAAKYGDLHGIDQAKVFIWLDVLCIPQEHPGLKTSAIQSLYFYASAADALIIIVPKTEHSQTHEACNADSCKKRVWCRTEHVAHFCHGGSANMYIMTDPCALEPLDPSWMQEVIRIFDGDLTCCRLKHPGNQRCDRESIVATLLGLYFDLFARQAAGLLPERCEEAWELVRASRDEIFPAKFSYISESGKVTQRQLFGDMIKLVEQFVKKDTAAALKLTSQSDSFEVVELSLSTCS